MIDQINKILKVLAINRQISIGGKKTKATTIQKVFPDLGETKCFTHAIQCISVSIFVEMSRYDFTLRRTISVIVIVFPLLLMFT